MGMLREALRGLESTTIALLALAAAAAAAYALLAVLETTHTAVRRASPGGAR
jgi:hypothetical protein